MRILVIERKNIPRSLPDHPDGILPDGDKNRGARLQDHLFGSLPDHHHKQGDGIDPDPGEVSCLGAVTIP